MTLSDLVKYSVMQSVTRSLCDSWACYQTGQGHSSACHKKWGFVDNKLWLWSGEIQTTLVHWSNPTAVYCIYMK